MAKQKQVKVPEVKYVFGRPTDYKPEYCQVLIDLMSEGASITEVAAEIGVNKSTIYEWVKNFEDFSDAKKIGEQLSEAWWEKAGRKNLATKEFNATLWYMNMKNRHGWKDKVENTGSMTITHEQALNELK
jgi:RPA family protein